MSLLPNSCSFSFWLCHFFGLPILKSPGGLELCKALNFIVLLALVASGTNLTNDAQVSNRMDTFQSVLICCKTWTWSRKKLLWHLSPPDFPLFSFSEESISTQLHSCSKESATFLSSQKLYLWSHHLGFLSILQVWLRCPVSAYSKLVGIEAQSYILHGILSQDHFGMIFVLFLFKSYRPIIQGVILRRWLNAWRKLKLGQLCILKTALCLCMAGGFSLSLPSLCGCLCLWSYFLTGIKSSKARMHEEKYFSYSRGYQDTTDFKNEFITLILKLQAFPWRTSKKLQIEFSCHAQF